MITRRDRRQRLTKVTSAVFLALAATVSAIIWNDRSSNVTTAFVANADVETASRILIARPDYPDLVLERQSGHWSITSPCRISADIERITPLLEALSTSPLSYPAREVDREAAGLLEPLAVVTIDDNVIQLGGTDLAGERRYAQRGDTIALVPEWVLSLANGGTSALAVRRLFPVTPTELTREDGRAVDIDAWSGLSATQVIAWPPADTPGTRHAYALEASIENDTNTRLELVATDAWTAIITAGDSCARLFANDDMPTDSAL